MRLPLLFGFILLSFGFNLKAQYTLSGKVIDETSREAIPFVSVVANGFKAGVYTDIDGRFSISLPEPVSHLRFSCVGYEPKQLNNSGTDELTIYLVRSVVEIAEAVVKAGDNPAETVIRKAIDAKAGNNPERGGGFRYDSYNKLIITADIDSALRTKPEKIAALDSIEKNAIDFFNRQHLFLMESVTERNFLPPSNNIETVKASRVSGLKNADFALLGTQLQSFSFYSEEIVILDKTYLSPLAYGALSKYVFTMEDSTFQDTDTVFVISYLPKKGRNFEGLTGLLYINSRGYAIQNVTAEPFSPTEDGLDLSIRQQYQLLEGRRWFPSQLNTLIYFNTLNLGSFRMMGVGRSYIRNVVLEPALRKRDFGHVTLALDPKASNREESFWSQFRNLPLDSLEKTTYHVIDSVGAAKNLDEKLKILGSLANGKIPIGMLELDLGKLMAYNDFEGFRAGLGITTGQRLSQKWSAGGYLAYGFKDEAWKYGGESRFTFDRKRDIYLGLSYHQDLAEFGGYEFTGDASWLNPAQLYRLFINRMERYEKYGAHAGFRTMGFATWKFSAERMTRDALKDYRFRVPTGEGIILLDELYELDLYSAELRLAPGEKFAETAFRRIAISTPNPVLQIKLTYSPETKSSEYEIMRVAGRLAHAWRIKNLGTFRWRIEGGIVQGDVPGGMLFNMRGTFREFGVFAPFSFGTMRTNEFMGNRFLAVHLLHDFGKLLVRGKKFQPGFAVLFNAGISSLDEPERHETLELRSADLPLMEAGLQINNLVKSQISSLGIGAVYRFGPQSLDSFRQNIALQLTFGLSL
jgi:hypothetical protein